MKTLPTILAAALLLAPALAHADIPPAGTGCSGKKLGDDCLSFWKVPNPSGGMPLGKTGPGKCVQEGAEINKTEQPVLRCRSLESPAPSNSAAPTATAPSNPTATATTPAAAPTSAPTKSCAISTPGQPGGGSALQLGMAALAALGLLAYRHPQRPRQ